MFMTILPRLSRSSQRSALGLIVLWLLYREPLHVYGMQKLIEHQAKDRVVNVRSRASLYQTIERLLRLGLVEVQETVRTEGLPDRIVYAITDAGRETARTWLREMLESTGAEYPEFIAAVSIVFGLPPAEASQALEIRAERTEAALADTEAALAASAHVPRLFLLEEEYRRTVLGAELAWLRDVIADIHAGRLSWSEQWLLEVAAQIGLPPDEKEGVSR
jgi:DNA-binding PadR family transcriptional regulator